MFARHVRPCIEAALADTPVVMLQGPRQSGKSTLASSLIEAMPGGRYLTLDDATVLAAARSDAAGFLSGIAGPAVIDEIQRAPELLVAIKAAVDRDRRPGQFLLTGSADVLLLPTVSESLAGRLERFVLWPLSQGELAGATEHFVDRLFAATQTFNPGKLSRDALIERLLVGGFPVPLSRSSPARRSAWFDSYVATILQRDVRELAAIDRLSDLPRLLTLLAARATGLTNHAEVARTIGLPQTTLKRYMALLEWVFLVRELPAWSGNLSKRLVKAPKLLVTDSGLAAHLTGATRERVSADANLLGPLLENFVAMEVIKQLAWSQTRPTAYHYRSHTGQEVDLVLEDSRGRLVGLEVKARQTVQATDFRGLKDLQAQLPERFVRGVVLYTGTQPVAFGDRLHALPIESLWQV